MKLVSVIIPVYKVEQYIAQTIESVLNQTYSNFEAIVVNDGTPDRSIEICQQFTDSRIKVISQENQGVSAARNMGIRHAKGDYIAFIDGDDLWEPEKLAKHVAHLENSPDVGLSFCPSAFIDLAGKPLGIYQIPKRLKNIEPQHIICRNPVGNGSVPVIRKAAIEAIKYQKNIDENLVDCYFDEQLDHNEDVECWLRISVKSQLKVEGIPEALTLYRVNVTGASTKVDKQLEHLEKMLEKASIYAPELTAKWGNAARAYQLRFVARRLVTLREGKRAVKYAHKAIATYWPIIIAEPSRTFITLAAAYSLCLLPQSLYKRIEEIGLKLTGKSQKRKILQEQEQ